MSHVTRHKLHVTRHTSTTERNVTCHLIYDTDASNGHTAQVKQSGTGGGGDGGGGGGGGGGADAAAAAYEFLHSTRWKHNSHTLKYMTCDV